MFIIRKEFAFSASHCLGHLPEGHPCSRVHGHNYIVTVELRSAILRNGFVRDYRELDCVKKFLDENWDHRHLNDVLPNISPTAENMAHILFLEFDIKLTELYAIEVSETPKTNARYER
jgi:6-pyruvoyltetrahydropterin/6-carboxytetrahydropterin synthase